MKQNEKSQESYYHKSSRKKWSVQDEPHALLKRLRSRLAEDGCAESQLMMGKTLLQFTEGDPLENQQQAVYWFIQSSLQGNAEATEELEKCLESGIGICEKNFQDVKTCLTMDLQGKLAAVAARNIFERLSEGSGFISEKSLVMEICDKNDVSVTANSLEEKYGGRRINETCLLNAAKDYTEGKLPTLIPYQQLCASEYNILNTTHLIMIQSLVSLFNRLYSVRKLLCIILVAAFLSPVSVFAVEEIAFCFMHSIYLCAFLCVLYSITSILLLNEHFKLFGLWGQLFHRHCLQIDCSTANSNFNSSYLPLFAVYFFSIAIIALLTIISKNLFVLLIFPFLFVCFLTTISLLKSSIFHVLSLCLFVVSVHPQYLANNLIPLFDMPIFLGYQSTESMHFLLSSSISLQIIGCFLSLLLVYWKSGILAAMLQLTLMACFRLTESWFVFINFDQIFIASCLIWVVILFPGIVKHLFRVLPGWFIYLVLFHNNYENTVCYLVSISLVAINYILMSISTKSGYLFNAVIILIPLSLFIYEYSDLNFVSKLDWESYQNACLPRQEASVNLVHDCSSLIGTAVQWEGVVKSIEVTSINNRVEAVIVLFPLVLQRPLRCFLGKKCFDSSNPTDISQLSLFSHNEGCCIHEYNSYSYDITVLMERPFWKLGASEISLRAGSKFKVLAGLLASGDSIRFTGLLDVGLGTKLPIVNLIDIFCKHCKAHHSINNLPKTGYSSFFMSSAKSVHKYALESLHRIREIALNNWYTFQFQK